MCLSSSSSCFSARAKANEEKFVKLRDVYQKLRSEHIVLLRTNGEAQKRLQTTEKESTTKDDQAKVRARISSGVKSCLFLAFFFRL